MANGIIEAGSQHLIFGGVEQMENQKQLINVYPDTAARLGVSRTIVYQLINSDGFPVVKIGGRKLVPVEGLDNWIKENTVTAASEK